MGEAKRRKAKDPNYGKGDPNEKKGLAFFQTAFGNVGLGIYLLLASKKVALSDNEKMNLSLFITQEWAGATDCCFVDATNLYNVACYSVNASQLIPILKEWDGMNEVKDLLEKGRKCIVFVFLENKMAEYRLLAF